MNIPDLQLQNRSLLKLEDITDWQMTGLIDFAIALKARKKAIPRLSEPLLRGKNIALLFQKSSTRTRCASAVAISDEGGASEYLNSNDIHLGKKESVPDSARVLGRMFDGIMFRGFAHEIVEDLARYAGIPVWNGLTDDWHPTQVLADLQTVKEHFGVLHGLKVAYVGDGRNNVCNSLMIGCAKSGIDFVDVCPPELSPDAQVLSVAGVAARRNGCTVSVAHDPVEGVRGANVIYTDVWVSMGEEALFDQRLAMLKPYQVTLEMMRNTGNLESSRVIFLHCLPAFHDLNTDVTRKLGGPLEVTDAVFSAPFSKVFDEAENRMHTIKAMMVASLYGV